jgi:hypothetical protein
MNRTPAGDRLRGLIAAVRLRWFAAVALRAIGRGGLVTALPGLAAALVYWLFAPRDGALLLLAGAALLLAAGGLLIVVRRIEPRPNDHRVARFIEERAQRAGAPPLDDAVVSAVQAQSATATDDRAAFAGLVVAGALKRLEGITPGVLVPPADVRRAGVIAATGVAFAIATLVITGPALSHVAQTARLRFFPEAVTLDVLPGDARVVAGQPLRIRARIQAGGADLARLSPQLIVTAGEETRTVEMTAAGGAFEFGFESIDRSFQYKVVAGRAASREYAVSAIFPPRVKRIDIDYRYPSFSGLAPRTEEDGGDIYAPAGTRVRLRVHADKPIASAELSLSAGKTALERAGQTLEADLVLSRDDSYRIRLVDEDGLASDGDSEYFIRLMDDRPPDVRIIRPSSDQGITPLEEVAIEARAEDDYGVASLELVFAVGGARERIVPFVRAPGGDTQATGAYLLAAEELGVRPGDVITYYAKARDVGRGKRPTESRSDLFFLEVRPFNEEFVAAQSQAGAGGGDPQVESLIEAQKEIISATWNIERRAAAGRSAEDMKAVAQAQAELRTRVERLVAGSRGRRGREPMPQQVEQRPPPSPGPAAGDPMAAALAAMAKAVEQLASGRTRDAIPHEMAALNGLVQAQAEVRRRQVAQQQAGSSGGGWGNRNSQDLSALFDKELQRQQRTNYEQRSQVEERPDQQKSDDAALDKIRELARRQEELSRQQREAARLAEDERRRQLERLTREQQELQRQAEQLSREMSGQQQSSQQQTGQQQSGQQQASQQQTGQQQASGQQSSGQQQSGQQQGREPQGGKPTAGNAAMRDAVEQMRQAASDLKREDAEGAARRGDRAAQQLRELEDRMRGTSADARQRAAADLQSEAQQILQEQRRIAAEAERLEKGGEGSTDDARRRLATDKDRLSERVDALQREARRLGSQASAKGSEGTRARDAADQLEQGKVGDRMRESAQQMRDGRNPPSGQAEQQLARTMEGVVDKLGGGASAETRQMAEQLAQSRQTRERLDALEARMREAEGKGDGQLDKLRQEYDQELRRTRDSLGRQQGAGSQTPERGGGGGTPEQHEYSRSAPGTEAFKQDRSGWESLRKEIDRALEARDAAASRKLAKSLGDDRLSAGGSERVPEEYRRLVARYYESLGKPRK